mmetsp:Transcript_119880/g.208127  ORF Transcript_119880/g.208127 Transcript_119880/m.208127 type:complete len:154 (-) Transcript_119880:145-606(-)
MGKSQGKQVPGQTLCEVRQELPAWWRAEYIDSSSGRHTFFRSQDQFLVVQFLHAQSSWFRVQLIPAKPFSIRSDGSTEDEEFTSEQLDVKTLPYSNWAFRVQPGAEEVIGMWRISAGQEGIVVTDTMGGDRHLLGDNYVQHHSGKRMPAVDTE